MEGSKTGAARSGKKKRKIVNWPYDIVVIDESF